MARRRSRYIVNGYTRAWPPEGFCIKELGCLPHVVKPEQSMDWRVVIPNKEAGIQRRMDAQRNEGSR